MRLWFLWNEFIVRTKYSIFTTILKKELFVFKLSFLYLTCMMTIIVLRYNYMLVASWYYDILLPPIALILTVYNMNNVCFYFTFAGKAV